MVADARRLCSPPPFADARVVAGEQHVGNRPAAPLRGSRVVRVLRRALERLARRTPRPPTHRRRARPAACAARCRHHHRGQLAAGQHVAADRDLVGHEVLEDPLVEALVAAAQQRELRLGRQLATPARRRAAGRPASARSRAARAQRRPGPRRSARAAPPPSRPRAGPCPAPPPNGVSSTCPHFSGVVARKSTRLERVPERERVRDVPLGPEPLEPLREQREDVMLTRRGTPGRCRSGAPRGRSSGCVAHQRDQRASPHLEHLDEGSALIRAHDADLASPSTTVQPYEVGGPVLVLLERRPRHEAARRRAAPRRPRATRSPPAAGSAARRCRRGARSRAAARRRRRCRAARRARAGRDHVEGAVEPVRPADPADRGPAHSTMSTRTRRLSLTAAALTTVRRAWAVRPPRPMTFRSHHRPPTARGRACRRPPRTPRPPPCRGGRPATARGTRAARARASARCPAS